MAWKPIILASTLLALVVVGIFGIRVREISIDGTRLVPSAAVRDSVFAWLAKERFALFPQSSVFLCAPNALERSLVEQFGFERVRVARTITAGLRIHVEERAVGALMVFSGGGEMLVGADGVPLKGTSIEQIERYKDKEFPYVVRFAWPVPMLAQQDDTLIAHEQLAHVAAIWAELVRIGGVFEPDSAMPKYGEANDYDITTKAGPIISSSARSGTDHQIAKLRSTLQEYPDPEQREQLTNIDLRYGDRVYIR